MIEHFVPLEQCRLCKYKGTIGGVPCCDFCFLTGHSRSTMKPRKDGRCPAFRKGERPVNVRALTASYKAITVMRPPQRKMYDHTQMMDLYNQGLTDREIADEMGCAPKTVATWRFRSGLISNRKKHTSKGDKTNGEQ